MLLSPFSVIKSVMNFYYGTIGLNLDFTDKTSRTTRTELLLDILSSTSTMKRLHDIHDNDFLISEQTWQ